MDDPKIEVHKSLNNNFLTYVNQSISRLNAPNNIYVEGYLVSLLSNFIEKEESFLSDQPLCLRISNSETLEDYVELGDETLFITGFFPERVMKEKSKSWVMGIGKDSYICAAMRLDYEGIGNIYGQLSQNFEIYSEVINDVKYNMLETISDSEFFNLYSNWKAYGNPRALNKIKNTETQDR